MKQSISRMSPQTISMDSHSVCWDNKLTEIELSYEMWNCNSRLSQSLGCVQIQELVWAHLYNRIILVEKFQTGTLLIEHCLFKIVFWWKKLHFEIFDTWKCFQFFFHLILSDTFSLHFPPSHTLTGEKWKTGEKKQKRRWWEGNQNFKNQKVQSQF